MLENYQLPESSPYPIISTGPSKHLSYQEFDFLSSCQLPSSPFNLLNHYPQQPLSFSWRWYFKRELWPLIYVTQFSWISPTYRGGILAVKLLFVFLLLICLLSLGSLSQEPRRVEGNDFTFLQTQCWVWKQQFQGQVSLTWLWSPRAHHLSLGFGFLITKSWSGPRSVSTVFLLQTSKL